MCSLSFVFEKAKKKKPLKGAIECNQARNTKITNNYKAITLIFNCLLTNFQNVAGEKTLLQRDSIRKFYLAVSANGDYQHNHHLSSCRRCVFCRISYSSPAGHLKENTNNEDMSQTRGERAGSGHMTATCWPCASRVTSSVGTPWGAVHGDCLQQRWQDGRTTFTHTHTFIFAAKVVKSIHHYSLCDQYVPSPSPGVSCLAKTGSDN